MPHRCLIFPGCLVDITPQDLSNNGLGFQVPACVQIRVSGGQPPAFLSSQAVYIYSAILVPSAALSDPSRDQPQTDFGIGQLFSHLMQIAALLCGSGFNDLESIQAKWLLILLQSEDAPQKLGRRATRS